MMEDDQENYEHREPGADDGAVFLRAVFDRLGDTSFARGWPIREMYPDFLHWCETSEEADEIILKTLPQFATLTLDNEEDLRMISLDVEDVAGLLRILLEAYEEDRIAQLLSR